MDKQLQTHHIDVRKDDHRSDCLLGRAPDNDIKSPQGRVLPHISASRIGIMVGTAYRTARDWCV